jgi:hypothetical protein
LIGRPIVSNDNLPRFAPGLVGERFELTAEILLFIQARDDDTEFHAVP